MDTDQKRLTIAECNRTTVKVGAGLVAFTLLLAGCETTKGPAPVDERAVVPTQAASISSPVRQDSFYVVQRGDTLYSIALKYGVNPQELAEWNNIADPNAIIPGQRINLTQASDGPQPTLFAVPQQSTMPIVDPTLDLTEHAHETAPYNTAAPIDPASQKVKTLPKALKLPYSEQNVAMIQHSENPVVGVVPAVTQTPVATGTGTRIENAPSPVEQRTDLAMPTQNSDWIWPANGRLISTFSANSKGLKISGQIGQAVIATAAGEVVYSGDGLRGYGNLIIIKHNDALLSAYAHNSKLLVKEGEAVAQGQVIAEMGDTDTDTPQLHFEIRRHGKPVDPLEFLPANPG